jgi:hypothetical protein
MKTHHIQFKLACLLACTFLATAGIISAQDAAPPSRLIQSPRIIFSQTVRKADGGLLTFQRIEPPEVVAAPVVAPVSTVATPESLLPSKSFAVGARVFEGSLTEVKWTHEGLTYKAWSSLDFRLLQGLGWFPAPRVRWHFIAMMSVERRAQMEAREARRSAAGLSATTVEWPVFPPEVLAAVPTGLKAWYVLVESPGTAAQEAAACAGMDALHAHAEANYVALQEQRVVREQKQAADAAWRAAHPEPLVQDTIIQFWPVKSALHLPQGTTSSTQGVQP